MRDGAVRLVRLTLVVGRTCRRQAGAKCRTGQSEGGLHTSACTIAAEPRLGRPYPSRAPNLGALGVRLVALVRRLIPPRERVHRPVPALAPGRNVGRARGLAVLS